MRLRLLRGRVAVRELHDRPSRIVLPDGYHDAHKREVRIHRATVLDMGLPALTKAGHEVPPGFRVGDVVWFVWALQGTEQSRTSVWSDGGAVQWVAQEEIVAVEERAI